MFPSKEVVLSAYKVLSTLSEDPTQQGATQKVSALRYFFAMDAFVRKTGREICDSKNSADRQKFTSAVADVVAISDTQYTVAFYDSIASHHGDCNTGSNFFSAGQVKNSTINPNAECPYPKRSGWAPLLTIKNGGISICRMKLQTGYANAHSYLGTGLQHAAFFIWLSRGWNCFSSASSFVSDLEAEARERYTAELVDELFPSKEDFSSFLDGAETLLETADSAINEKDIQGLFSDGALPEPLTSFFRPDILAAIRSKPFILLAGMSGTGKTRIVRQLARGFCPAEGELADAPLCPGNYACIPVRPDWHDSTGLMGYVTRITDDGRPRYVSTDFIRFLAKAWLYEDEEVPFFLCLDEMNLAPVEQYFAEYLSVVESRQVDTARGRIATDQLVRVADKELLRALVDEVYREDKHERVEHLKAFFLSRGGIPIPSNFVVMGTVNMDETTCSFSRKVLDRAMTFEFNEFDIDEGLASNPDIAFGSLQPTDAQCRFTHGCQVYAAAHDVCDRLKPYLTAVNKAMDARLQRFGRNVLTGTLNFGNDVGKFDMAFAYRKDGKERTFCFTVEILSVKLDYHRDWTTLVREIEAEHQTLALDFLKETYHSFDVVNRSVPKDQTADMIWWSLFKTFQTQFVAACRLILNRPRRRWRRQGEALRIDQMRTLSCGQENEFAEFRRDGSHLYWSARTVDDKDTPENRFLKMAVFGIEARHAALAGFLLGQTGVSEAAKDEIRAMCATLKTIRRNPFFRGIGRFRGLRQESLVLQRASGYSAVWSRRFDGAVQSVSTLKAKSAPALSHLGSPRHAEKW